MAVYTAIPTGGNWSSAATWGGAGFPVAGDTANIPSTCLAPVTVDVASACLILNCTGFNSNLVMSNTLTIATGGSVTLPSGASGALTGSAALILNGAVSLTTNNKAIPALTYGTAGTKTVTGTFDVTGLFTVSAATIQTGGILSIKGGATFTGNLSGSSTVIIYAGTISGAGVVSVNSLQWSGSGAVTIAGGVSLNNFDHTSFTGTLTINSGVLFVVAGTTVLNASATYTSGGAGASIRFGGAGAYNMTSNGVQLPFDFSCNTGNVHTLLDNWTITGQFTTLTTACTFNGFKFILQSTVTLAAGLNGTTVYEFGTGFNLAGGAGGSSATFVFNGNGTISGSFAIGNGSIITYTSGTINASSGTLSIISSNVTLNIGSSINFGTLSSSSSGNPTNITLNNDLYCVNIAGSSNAIFTFNSLTSNVYCSGSLPTSNVVTLQGTSKVIMNGTGNINNSSLSITVILEINTAGTISIGAAIIRLLFRYIAGNITNISGSGYLGCYSGVSLDIANIPTMFEIRAMTSSAITLLSNLNCKSMTAGTAVTLNFSGSFNITCQDIVISTNSGIYCPNGSLVTVTNSITLYPTSGTVPSLRALAGIMYLKYTGTYANCLIFKGSLVNIDASQSTIPIYIWGAGVATNCTNVKVVTGADIGGGGGLSLVII